MFLEHSKVRGIWNPNKKNCVFCSILLFVVPIMEKDIQTSVANLIKESIFNEKFKHTDGRWQSKSKYLY